MSTDNDWTPHPVYERVCVCVSIAKSKHLFISGEHKSLVLDCEEGSADSEPG